MADTARTFHFTQDGKVVPLGPPTFLDATSPTGNVGKISIPVTTSTVVVQDAAKKLKAAAKPVARSKKKKLMPLSEWNLRRENTLVGPQKNGIACPECGDELYDMDEPCFSNTHGTFLNIACMCGWSGNRRA